MKEFDYRGSTEEWSNQYWFTGAPPAGDGGWRALFDEIANLEKTVYTSLVTIVGGYGYADNAPGSAAVWGVDLRQAPNVTIPGTLPAGTTTPHPGDVAIWVRWRTSRRSLKGKPVFLRKYFHDARDPASIEGDIADPVQSAALDAFADSLGSGTLGFTVAAQGHPDEVIVERGVAEFVTTRTLKKRGKRKKAETVSSSAPSVSQPASSSPFS